MAIAPPLPILPDPRTPVLNDDRTFRPEYVKFLRDLLRYMAYLGSR